MSIYLLRHGETTASNGYFSDNITEGHGLSEIGRRNVRATAKKLKGKMDIVLCSDLLRARQTAEIVSKIINVPFVIDNNLRELYFGSWSNKAVTEIEQDSLTNFYQDPIKNMPLGGEDINSIRKRINYIEDIIVTNKSKNILLISHARFINILISYLVYDKICAKRRIEIENSKISKLEDFEKIGWRLLYLNN